MPRWRHGSNLRQPSFWLLALLSCMRVNGAQPPLRSLRTSSSSASGGANANIRRAVLCTLAVQNACQMLSMRYSRMPGQPKYLTSTAVVTAEATKIAAAFQAFVRERLPADVTAEFVAHGASPAIAVPVESQAKETFQTKLTQAVLGRLEVPPLRTILATPRQPATTCTLQPATACNSAMARLGPC